MRNWILITLYISSITIPEMSKPVVRPSIISHNIHSQSEDAQETDKFMTRLRDVKFSGLIESSMWTLTHDYKDSKQVDVVLNTVMRYLEAFTKYEQGDGSSLKQLGGTKQLKGQLAIWLNDNDQAVRAFAATMLGISGDHTYAPQIAKLLLKKEQTSDHILYDRGRAALALGILQAKEYSKEIVMLLSSTNEFDRSGAAQGLGWMGNKEHAKAVAQLLNDGDENVRAAAKYALEMMGASELIKDKNEEEDL